MPIFHNKGCGMGSGAFTDSRPHIVYAGTPFSWTKDAAIAAADVTNYSGRVSTYSASGLPTGVTCNASTGQLTGTPTVESSGTATISATGPSGLVGTATITWDVAAAAGVLLTDLVGYWNLDEASGTRNDSHTNALHLTDNNTVTSNATGGPDGGQCAQFTSANSEYLSRASEAALQTGDIDVTIAGWVYADTFGDFRVNFGKGGEFYVNAGSGAGNNNLRFVINNFRVATSATELSTGTWYFVVGWRDSANLEIRISINDGAYDSGVDDPITTDGNPFVIGAYHDGTVPFNGRMAYVGYWKRVLTADERTWLYNAGAGRTYAAVAAWGGP